jgi:2-dehydropantoate 2-reductase
VKIAIFGAGAIGCLLAWALTRSGHSPTLVARGETLKALRNGLTITPKQGPSETIALRLSDDVEALGPQDIVIGTLKAQDWLGALPAMRHLVGPDTTLVPAVNGIPWWYFDGLDGPYAGTSLPSVDADGALMRSFPAERLVGCVVHTGVVRSTPASIRWLTGGRFVVGSLSRKVDERPDMIAGILRAGGFVADVGADIRREVWTKLMNNAVVNPLSVVLQATMGDLAGNANLLRVTREAMAEVVAVAAVVGAPVSITIEQRIALNATMPTMKTSMLQDFEARRALELGSVVDAVVEIGRMAGVSTPVIATIGQLAAGMAALRHGVTSERDSL